MSYDPVRLHIGTLTAKNYGEFEKQMKNHFPFTDYDFYAYLTSGAMLLAAVDFVFAGGGYLARTDWTVVQVIVAVALAYVTGQLAATLSAVIFENWLARTILRPPFAILVGTSSPRRRETLVARWAAAPYYRALPEAMQRKIVERAKRDLDVEEITAAEQVFQPAYAAARKDEDTRNRLDDFRNQYGFSRNMAFVAAISLVMLLVKEQISGDNQYLWLAAGAAIFCIGMIARFLKFYASFAADVARAYAFGEEDEE
jgi:hypothetical protein